MREQRLAELLKTKNCAVLCIDLQTVYFEGGSLVTTGAKEALPCISNLLDICRGAHLPIIFTQELHRKERVDFGRELDGTEPEHVIEDWPESSIYEPFKPRDGEFLIVKRRYSGFFGTDLEILLRGLRIQTIILLGAITDVCIHYTAVDAHQRDYHLVVVKECCIGSSTNAHEAALNAIEYLQKGSVVTLGELKKHINKI